MIITHSNKFLTPKSNVVGGIYSDKLNVIDVLFLQIQ